MPERKKPSAAAVRIMDKLDEQDGITNGTPDDLVLTIIDAELKPLIESLQLIHDECCVTHHGRLNYGPMLEPSEESVMQARKALSRARGENA